MNSELEAPKQQKWKWLDAQITGVQWNTSIFGARAQANNNLERKENGVKKHRKPPLVCHVIQAGCKCIWSCMCCAGDFECDCVCRSALVYLGEHRLHVGIISSAAQHIGDPKGQPACPHEWGTAWTYIDPCDPKRNRGCCKTVK